MNSVWIVETKDTASEWRMIEAIHSTAEGAEATRKDRQMIWGNGTNLNPRRYIVSVREMTLNP